jgi:hypothetical protein
MPKGFFSQTLCLLTDGTTTVGDIQSALRSAKIPIAKELPPGDQWAFSGPGLLVPFRPDVNGTVNIDLVNQPWPDAMGHPKSDPIVFGAWTMGFFGPFTYPGNFERACQHTWNWEDAPTIAPIHRGFIRLRMTYAGGGDKDAPILPQDYNPHDELVFLSRLVLALANVRGILCYFNPGGEILRDLPSFRATWDNAFQQKKEPLLLWMDARLFTLNDQLGFMDTVGNGQLDVKDVEAFYPRNQFEPDTIAYYLRNVTHYLLDSKRDIQTGEPIDGPKESSLSWIAENDEEGICAPPRPVVRLYPKSLKKEIHAVLSSLK